MQPTGHVSTPKQYSSNPNKTSGAQYHKVSISWVSAFKGIENTLASPKSAILTTLVLSLISIF